MTVATNRVRDGTTVNSVSAVKPWHREMMPGKWAKLGDMEVGLVDFTPAIWEVILRDHNSCNRPVQKNQVEFLGRVLTNEQWIVTGETIIFSNDGVCLNGQHRGMASVKTGIGFTSLVVVGVESAAFKVMDQHSKRNLAHVLGILKYERTSTLAGATNIYANFLKGGNLVTCGKPRPSIDDQLAILAANPGLVDAAEFVSAFEDTKLFGGTTLPTAFLHAVAPVNRPLADRFLTVIINQTIPETTEWSGARQLAKRLMTSLGHRSHKLTRTAVSAFTIKAWNAVLVGDKVNQLKWDKKEKFPELSGWIYEDGKPVAAQAVVCPHFSENK